MTAGTLLSGQSQSGGLDLAAAGSWTAEYARTLEPLVDAAIRSHAAARNVVIDMAQVDLSTLTAPGCWSARYAYGPDAAAKRRSSVCADNHSSLFEKCVPAPTH